MNRSQKTWMGSLLLTLLLGGVAFYYLNDWQTNDIALLQGRYERGDMSGTIAAITASDSLTPELALLESRCYRQLGQIERFMQWLPRGESAGLNAETIQLAKDMFDVQLGSFDESPTRMMRELERRGASANDARVVVIQGSIAKGDIVEAERLIEQEWGSEATGTERSTAGEPPYLRALAARTQSLWSVVEQQLLEAILLNPLHEVSYLTLADFYSQPPNIQFEKARYILQQAQLRFPHNQTLRLRLAQVNRELGDLNQARELLTNKGPTNKGPESEAPTPAEQLEMAEVALDAGRYAESVELLGQAGLRSAEDLIDLIDSSFALNVQGRGGVSEALAERATWGAIAWSLSGHTAEALKVFDIALDRVARTRRHTDLQVKRRLYPQDQAIVDELNALLSPAYTPRYPTMAEVAQEQRNHKAHPPSAGEELYQAHCAVCHGNHGDGFGPAARHLFPLPRNFRGEPMRMVSAKNRLATDADLINTIKEGLGGASMPAFGSFSAEQLSLLVAVLRRWQEEGLSDQYAAQIENSDDERGTGASGDQPEEKSLENGDTTRRVARRKAEDGDSERNWIQQRLVPSEQLAIPLGIEAIATMDLTEVREEVSLAAGAKLFRQTGCHLCHADSIDAITDDIQTMTTTLFDSLGRPIQARDLLREPFRRGNSAVEIYQRLVLGIPGTPHPALSDLDQDQLKQLVLYVVQLNRSIPDKRRLTNADRRQRLSSGNRQ